MIQLRILRAQTFFQRLRGLMFYPTMPAGYDALLLDPCRAIHGFFMRFAIDAVFLDKDNRILKVATCPPWSVGPMAWRAQRVLEMRAGAAEKTGFVEGMRITV